MTSSLLSSVEDGGIDYHIHRKPRPSPSDEQGDGIQGVDITIFTKDDYRAFPSSYCDMEVINRVEGERWFGS